MTFLFPVLFSCQSEEEKNQGHKIDPRQFKDQLLKVNKYTVEKESDEITQYIAAHGWNMEKSGTGLRYLILKKGEGEPAQSGNRVKVNYRIALLDGTVCYSSEEEGAYEFKVEADAVESGLHEGIQHLCKGAKAIFILPSYLAHGLHGDDAKIPPLSPLRVDIELLEIKQ